MNTDATLELACDLIRRPSVTPADEGCQALIAERLAALGCHAEHIRYGDVDNLWLTHGSGRPLTVLLGHTDVVPSGPETEWQTPPFEPTISHGHLYGRGAADMKGSVAAMVVAMENFLQAHPDHNGTIALLLTSDEEGVARDGVRRVVSDFLAANGIDIDYCLVGEPSSHERLGDTIKNGRRGSLGGRLIVRGSQGHVAYPHLAENPFHRAAASLATLCETQWDRGNDDFPPTSFQISNIHAGTGADNVIPGTLEVLFNFRFSTEVTADELKQRVHSLLDAHNLNYELDWRLSGEPFQTPRDSRLLQAAQQAGEEVLGYPAQTSTAGGTSDGRFIAPLGAEVIELGPLNATIHKINECVAVDDLSQLTRIYHNILSRLLL
ncbi:succinyl-diaminopimelate desuccinylase [Methylohalomonas lacus]|uniref:Succinyl-diaminopimelate desuccinylase n=1 Tax=Methylohalomonas lacus TaxID=398773 RepID=A0AAE3L0P6_9GAMM|nr:succinyl-diaminopimelate desuccinylase [Methylohalomonas lacus]MCS3902889.1 succinyl-diaminopimelate desuccinylase [Methylohalomonas lacus]